MALFKNGQDDDFFGNDDDEDCFQSPPPSLSVLTRPDVSDGGGRGINGDACDDDDDGIHRPHYGQPQHQEGSGCALAEAESSALQERFRKLGFHEGYDQAKDERLQEGFETGYREAFAVSTRIGILLGEATLNSKLPKPIRKIDTGNEDGTSSGDKVEENISTITAPEPIYLAAARQIIKRLTEPDTLSKNCDLPKLESEVRNILQS
jgi:hypothetical protein